MMSKKPKFIQHLEKNGYFGSIVSIRHLDELRREIQSLHNENKLDGSIYDSYGKAYLPPHPLKSFPNAKSIIVVAVPQPMIRTTFNWEGKAYQFVIPPTYADYYRIDRQLRRLLAGGFKPKSYRFVKARLPVKLLAVRSGLALYGKNNITYVSKYGSFHRLMAFYTDYDSPIDYWQEKKSLPLCYNCEACLNACPTKAIQKDRFMIRADICLTCLNEKDSKHGFPNWVDISAHNSLVGCMHCQRVCPYDKNAVNWYEDRIIFSEKETSYLLKGEYSGMRAEKIEKKLKKIGLDLTLFPRNLNVLLSPQHQ